MRVLHLYAGNLYGGVERLLVTLAGHRDAGEPMAPEVALCFLGRLRDELLSTGIPVHDLGPVRVRRFWSVLQARRRLRELLSRGGYDVAVCHSCWLHALFAPVVRQADLPLAFWAHDVPRGTHWLERWARRTPPDLVIANSEFTKAQVPKLFPAVKCEVCYSPVPLPLPVDRRAARDAVRKELGVPDDVTVILQSCRLERWKGHTLLLRALRQVGCHLPWVCWITGSVQRPHEAVYLRDLQHQVADGGLSERVKFLGLRSDLPAVLAAADIHCQPNTGPEPLGVAFVEALLAGLPVVTTALGGATEIVTPACGRLVPPDDVNALAGALSELIRDPAERARLGQAGPSRARELFDLSRQLRHLERRLRTITGRAVAV